MKKTNAALLVAILALLTFACKKSKSTIAPESPVNEKRIYTDSLFFIQATDATIKPATAQNGTYSSLPEGLRLDQKTGEIDVNKSESGLKYRVTFTSASGIIQHATVIISGINYEDRIYNLSKGDSIAQPIYNGDSKLGLPGSAHTFDENGGCKKAGILVDKTNAKINLALSVRSQAIDTGATEQVKLTYRMNDGSNKALNSLEVKIYFYRTENEIPKYLSELLAQRKIINTTAVSAVARTLAVPRSRPPCIIVVSR